MWRHKRCKKGVAASRHHAPTAVHQQQTHGIRICLLSICFQVVQSNKVQLKLSFDPLSLPACKTPFQIPHILITKYCTYRSQSAAMHAKTINPCICKEKEKKKNEATLALFICYPAVTMTIYGANGLVQYQAFF